LKLIPTITKVIVHWTEGDYCPEDNTEMTGGEFRSLLSRIRRDEDKPGQIGYCKVMATITWDDGQSANVRIDVTGDWTTIDMYKLRKRLEDRMVDF
jgi:hypothetical protein